MDGDVRRVVVVEEILGESYAPNPDSGCPFHAHCDLELWIGDTSIRLSTVDVLGGEQLQEEPSVRPLFEPVQPAHVQGWERGTNVIGSFQFLPHRVLNEAK